MEETRCYSCHIKNPDHLQNEKTKKDYLEKVSGNGVIFCTVCGCRVIYEQTREGSHRAIFVSK